GPGGAGAGGGQRGGPPRGPPPRNGRRGWAPGASEDSPRPPNGAAMKPMPIRPVTLTAIVAGALIAFPLGLGAGVGVGLRLGSSPAPGPPLCAANPCRVTMTRNGLDGLIIKDARGPKVENSLLIVDPAGLAEFWQNAAGAYEGPRGEI